MKFKDIYSCSSCVFIGCQLVINHTKPASAFVVFVLSLSTPPPLPPPRVNRDNLDVFDINTPPLCLLSSAFPETDWDKHSLFHSGPHTCCPSLCLGHSRAEFRSTSVCPDFPGSMKRETSFHISFYLRFGGSAVFLFRLFPQNSDSNHKKTFLKHRNAASDVKEADLRRFDKQKWFLSNAW